MEEIGQIPLAYQPSSLRLNVPNQALNIVLDDQGSEPSADGAEIASLLKYLSGNSEPSAKIAEITSSYQYLFKTESSIIELRKDAILRYRGYHDLADWLNILLLLVSRLDTIIFELSISTPLPSETTRHIFRQLHTAATTANVEVKMILQDNKRPTVFSDRELAGLVYQHFRDLIVDISIESNSGKVGDEQLQGSKWQRILQEMLTGLPKARSLSAQFVVGDDHLGMNVKHVTTLYKVHNGWRCRQGRLPNTITDGQTLRGESHVFSAWDVSIV